jgi:porin
MSPLLLALSAFPAPAADLPAPEAGVASRNPLVESRSESDHLLGDWAGGARSRLAGRGVHLQAGYIGEVIGNVAGGLKRGAIYEGLGQIALELDLARLSGGRLGLDFRVSGIYPHGARPSGKLIGDLQTASNIDAYDSPALYELWLEHRAWADRISLRAGRLLADVEFAVTEYGGVLANSSFGWPAFISGNTLNSGPAYFRTALGARLRVQLREGFYAQAGVYDGDIYDSPLGRPGAHPGGLSFRLNADQGALVLAESGWSWNHSAAARGLPGSFKAGGWLHTADFANPFNPARTHTPNYGAYFAVEQAVWRENHGANGAQQGLGVFLRAGASPPDRNLFTFALDGGLHYRGLIPGRDVDVAAVGVAVVKLSNELRRAERAAGAAVVSDYELALEATYDLQLAPWWSLQPDFQWIHHPGGSRALNDAFVVGLRTRITF